MNAPSITTNGRRPDTGAPSSFDLAAALKDAAEGRR